MVNKAKENLSGVKDILVDAGYTGENFATQIKDIIGATVEVIKRSELHSFAVLPKRWVVKIMNRLLQSIQKTFTINVQRDKLKTVYSSVAQW